MPLQNRVTPFGEITAVAARGTFMGNRGIIHNPVSRTLEKRRWQHKAWICCVLEYKDWQHPIMGPGAYTELFFLDEATALAAGHRPCALCRRDAFNAFKKAFGAATDCHEPGSIKAPGMDQVIHTERVTRNRQKVTYRSKICELPSGVFVAINNQPILLHDLHLLPWSPSGYENPVKHSAGLAVDVLTPRTIVATIREGYRPDIHSSAVR